MARGHDGLKLNWDTVFLNLDFREGSRVVDLAQINGLTKQAMSQIVAEIEQQGYMFQER
ncbi:MAG: MarR family transcriptional regulator [Cellvibrionales bacterium]|nr:MarR family transcriptional regulator [Cellvibrionales bacterium]